MNVRIWSYDGKSFLATGSKSSYIDCSIEDVTSFVGRAQELDVLLDFELFSSRITFHKSTTKVALIRDMKEVGLKVSPKSVILYDQRLNANLFLPINELKLKVLESLR